MKKTLFIAISLLCGSVATAFGETVILNITNDTTSSYTSTSQIISLGDKENGSTPGAIKSASFSLNGATVTATFETGYGVARNYLSSADEWTNGLPNGITDHFGLTESDTSTITRSGVITTGSNSDYPGKITLTLSGLSAGSYDLSGLSALVNGNSSITSWHLSLNSISVTDATVASYSYDATTGSWTNTGTQTSFLGSENGSASAQYVSFNNINVTEENSTLVLHIDGNITPGTQKGFQFAAITSTTVPEPSTAVLSLLALGALSLRHRRS